MEHTEPHLYPSAELLDSMKDEWLQNPAFRFFGKRLITEQSLPEFLNELLLILFSPKRLAQQPCSPIEGCFPSRKVLERFTFEKGETRGGGTAPPGPK